MAETGYLFLLRCFDQASRVRRQGIIVDIIGVQPAQPKSTIWAPHPKQSPPLPATRGKIMRNVGSPETRRDFALFFAAGMTVDQYVRLADKLRDRRITKADILAMMGDQRSRDRVEKTFDRTRVIDFSELLTVEFSAFKAQLRNNDDDERVVVED